MMRLFRSPTLSSSISFNRESFFKARLSSTYFLNIHRLSSPLPAFSTLRFVTGQKSYTSKVSNEMNIEFKDDLTIDLSRPKKMMKRRKVQVKNGELYQYLTEELKYTAKDLNNTISRQITFFEMDVERFKDLADVVRKARLSEKVLWQYYATFKVDDFESLGDKLETIKYLQEMFGEMFIKRRNDISQLIRMRKEDYLRKNAVIEKELSVKDEEFIGLAFKNRAGMWLKSENDLRSILRLLKEEYGMREEELRSWFTEGNSACLFSEKIFKDGAERKLIFEDVYGSGCFEKKKTMRTNGLSHPQLLSKPVSRYYGTINRLMEVFSYDSPKDLKWLPVSTLYSTNLDRIEKRVEVMYKYFTNGKELRKVEKRKGGEGGYKVDRSRYETSQREWERKYRMDGVVKDEDKDGVDGSKVADEVDGIVDMATRKTKKVRSGSIDEERLYEDYVRWMRGEKRVDGLENAYEELVSRSLSEYGEKGMLDVLYQSGEGKGVEGYEEYRKEMEEKLGRVGLSMEDVYRELWKESCGVELSEDEAMTCIKDPGGLTSQISSPMRKLGMLSVYLCLNRSEAQRALNLLSGLFTYSLEIKLFSRLQMLVPVVERYISRRSEQSSNGAGKEREVSSDKKKKEEVLRECVEMYREHPVRKTLRSFVLQDIGTCMSLSPIRWKKGIEIWESSEDRDRLETLYRYVRSESL